MATNAKYVQAQTFTLAGAGVTLAATSITLNSFTQIDGTTLLTMSNFGTKGYATLEPGNGTFEEQISFTGVTQNSNGTATLTGVNTVGFVYPYTETSGTAMSHSGGTSLVLSNTAGFYSRFANTQDDQTIVGLWTFPSGANNPVIGTVYAAPTTDLQIATKKYIDDIAIAGSPLATDSVQGITKLSVAAVSPTDPIAVGTNDTRMPTQDQKDAMAGTGTPSSSNKFVTADTLAASFPAGVVQMYGGASAPTGWLFCDGSSQLRASFAALFTAIGTTYGSADGTHFNVPDMRGRTPIGVGTGTGGGTAGTGLPTGGSALTAVVAAGWKGEETHTLVISEMPAHTHSGTFGSNIASGTPNPVYTQNNSTTTGAVPSQGGDGAHNNIQPVMGINFIIKT